MIITKLNGEQIDVTKNGVYWLSHVIPSIEVEHNFEDVDGRDGAVLLNTIFKQRTILVRLLYDVIDIQDFYLLRDELNALFVSKQAFYISFKEEPYRRWKVKLAQQFEMLPNPQMEAFELQFITVNIFGESLATTRTPREWDVDLWAWDGALNWDDADTFIHTTNNFTIKNLGTAPINPKQSDLEIIVKGNFTSNLTIRNLTTGDTYILNRKLSSGETLVINKVNSLVDGVSVFGQTNKRLINLAAGENRFEITGGTIESIEFNFRFLFM